MNIILNTCNRSLAFPVQICRRSGSCADQEVRAPYMQQKLCQLGPMELQWYREENQFTSYPIVYRLQTVSRYLLPLLKEEFWTARPINPNLPNLHSWHTWYTRGTIFICGTYLFKANQSILLNNIAYRIIKINGCMLKWNSQGYYYAFIHLQVGECIVISCTISF